MTEQERAAELADEVANGESSGLVRDAMQIFTPDERATIVAGLRLLAATPASAEVIERVAKAMAIADGSKDPDALFAPPQTMNSPRDPYPVWMEWLGQVEAALSAIRPGDRLPAGVVRPEEVPAPKWLDRVAEEISEYRGLQAGWDGENAEAPSAHSVNEAVEFIRSLERGDIEPALHADGTVIILIGHTTLRFTDEGMSFVTRAALAAVEEPTNV